MTHITLDRVTLRYPIYNIDTRSLRAVFVDIGTGGRLKKSARNAVIVEALKNVSLSLKDGDTLGLVGPNGSGKSTLLRVLAGLYEPTLGTISREGAVSTLFDLSLGMDQEATGYENIRLMGALRGLRGKEIDEAVANVAEFSELNDYLKMPIRTYSAGMAARLGFSIATTIKPEILLIDEVLGTGDQHFLHKARKRMDLIMQQARIFVLASHSNDMIRQFCKNSLLLLRGRVFAYGPTDEIIREYERILS